MYYFFYLLRIVKSDFIKNWDTQLRKGLLPLFVLHIIQRKEQYGYELIVELKATASFEVTESTIYPMLTRMTKDGLLQSRWVEQGSGIPRKYYSLTPEGKKKLKEMKQVIQRLFTNLSEL